MRALNANPAHLIHLLLERAKHKNPQLCLTLALHPYPECKMRLHGVGFVCPRIQLSCVCAVKDELDEGLHERSRRSRRAASSPAFVLLEPIQLAPAAARAAS